MPRTGNHARFLPGIRVVIDCNFDEKAGLPSPPGNRSRGENEPQSHRTVGICRCRLCANLTLCYESADSQAFPALIPRSIVNQLRNIALGKSAGCRNIVIAAAEPLKSNARPCHPQSFPQAGGVLGSSFVAAKGRARGARLRAIHPARCCLPSSSQNAWNCAGRPD
jgi:hypothetical protein